MKTNRSLLKNILIILIVTFLIVPFVFSMFELDKQVYETFSTYTKDADDVSMSVFSYGDGGNRKYAYCINGDISCGTGQKRKLDSSNSRYTQHKASDASFNLNMYVCDRTNNISDGKFEVSDGVMCLNSAFSSGNVQGSDPDKYINFFNFNEDGDPGLSKGIIRGHPDGNGFTVNYDKSVDFPVEFVGKYAIYNDEEAGDISYSICPLFEKYGDCWLKRNQPNSSGTDSGDQESDDEDESGEVESGEIEKTNFRCVADYGAEPGDDLCCGQTGVVQNNSDTCPHEYPKCYGYKCGQKWGVCGRTSSSS